MDVDDGDVVAVSFIGDVGGTDEIVQSYQFRLESVLGGMSSLDMFSDMVEVFTAIWAIIDNLYTVQTIFRNIRARNVTKGTILGIGSFVPPQAGIGVGSQAAYQTTIPISFSTSYPRIVLRKMIGPLDVNVLDPDGFVTPSAQAAMASYASLMLGYFIQTHGTWNYGYQSPVALQYLVPSAASVTNRPGGLNRRRAGRGS